jgi:hypothetical protein
VRRSIPVRLLAAWLFALVLAGTALAGCAGATPPVRIPRPPAGAPPLHAGLIVNALDAGGAAGRRRELAKARALGVHWIREELRWGDVERSPGRYRWGRFDTLLIAAARARLHVLPLLLGTPRWAGSDWFSLPSDTAAYGAFAAAAAARYGPGGAFWRAHRTLDASFAPRWFELWNEPYLPAYSRGGVDPVRYAAMVRAATVAGHAANPATRWLMAADLTYQDPSGARRDWLRALVAADSGVIGLADGVAVHPYVYGSPDATGAPIAFSFGRVNAIADELTRLGRPTMPLWITELGWSTCDVRPNCGSEHDQAQWLADVFTRVRRRPLSARVRALFVYHLHDFPGRAAGDREAHYGLLRTNGTRKPAWSVVRREALFAGG